MTKQTSILIVHTGGTIGMVKDQKTNALAPIHFDNLFDTVPTLKMFEYKLDIFAFKKLIDSSNVDTNFWKELANVIEVNYNNYDGFVILHGTDTMSYSASMLSFMLENNSKPIIFTGSQLPLGIIRSDGRENFVNAIELAAARHSNGEAIVPEVALLFENKLFRGNRTYKFSAENFNAFFSGNYPPLANVGVNIKYNNEHISQWNKQTLKVHKNLCTDVAVLKIFPGITKNTVDSVINTPNLKGLVIETYGSGNAPTHDWFISSLERAINKGVIVLNVTQCHVGAVVMGKYETSVQLSDIGVVGGYDITLESAVTKLMFLLGQDLTHEKIVNQLNTSIRGEITV